LLFLFDFLILTIYNKKKFLMMYFYFFRKFQKLIMLKNQNHELQLDRI